MLYPIQNITPLGKLTLVESLLKQKLYPKALAVYESHIRGADLGHRFDGRVSAVRRELEKFTMRVSKCSVPRNATPLTTNISKRNLLAVESATDKDECTREKVRVVSSNKNVNQSGESRSNWLKAKSSVQRSCESSQSQQQLGKVPCAPVCRIALMHQKGHSSQTGTTLKKSRSRSSLSRGASTCSLIGDRGRGRRSSFMSREPLRAKCHRQESSLLQTRRSSEPLQEGKKENLLDPNEASGHCLKQPDLDPYSVMTEMYIPRQHRLKTDVDSVPQPHEEAPPRGICFRTILGVSCTENNCPFAHNL